ncbi:hypothetical protein AK973_5302 [Pseudomonas brassicacearum]|nr:hypothetical protein AK973_5302 [Pseudomonas brassicacearum]
MRGSVIRHRCGFPFYLNDLLYTKNSGAARGGRPDTASTRSPDAARIQ